MGLCGGTPAVAVAYQPKAASIYADLGLAIGSSKRGARPGRAAPGRHLDPRGPARLGGPGHAGHPGDEGPALPLPLRAPRAPARTPRPARAQLRGRQGEAPGGAVRPRRSRLPWRVLIAALALAAVIAGAVAHAMAGDQERGDLLPPSIATDDRGLSTVAWTEIGAPACGSPRKPRRANGACPSSLMKTEAGERRRRQ